MLVIDVDAVAKLAHWSILPLLPELTGCGWDEIGTVSSLTHRARRAVSTPDGKLFRTSVAATAALDAISRMRANLEGPSDEVLDELSASNQIDSGEAVLLATIANDPHGRFLTGDKRALRALAGLDCARQFAGKIMMVEHIVWLCLEAKGRDWLLQNVCPARDADQAISMILGSRCDASLDSLREGILSYIREIAALHNPSLIVDLPSNRPKTART
ncbi:MAG: hypothetical protein JNM37_17320 [Rhodocyclaceae bacterium]|nr:hypothetical protein [Rhodocyclaceae bacterium]